MKLKIEHSITLWNDNHFDDFARPIDTEVQQAPKHTFTIFQEVPVDFPTKDKNKVYWKAIGTCSTKIEAEQFIDFIKDNYNPPQEFEF